MRRRIGTGLEAVGDSLGANRAGGGTLMGFLDFAAKKAAGAPGISRREGEADKL